MSEEFEHTRMTLGEHLAELRSRLFKGLAAVAVVFALAWWWQSELTAVVMRPFHQSVQRINAHWDEEFSARVESGEDPLRYYTSADPETRRLLPEFRVDDRLTSLSPTEGYVYLLRVCLYVALFLGGPVLLWQLWGFIAAGLYDNERRAALRYFPYSAALFVLGVLFGYFLMVPWAMYFLGIAFEPEVVRANWRLEYYFSLLSALTLALAVVFQLPVLMTFGARMGLVTPAQMARFRPYFVVVAFVVGGILTPPDPFTQSMLAVPMVALYELGVIAAKLTARKREVPA